MDTTRKTWSTPQVFTLGADNTRFYGSPATGESVNHISGVPAPYDYLNSRETGQGVQS